MCANGKMGYSFEFDKTIPAIAVKNKYKLNVKGIIIEQTSNIDNNDLTFQRFRTMFAELSSRVHFQYERQICS